MTILFHPTITLAEAKAVADGLGCALVNDGRGNTVITPRHIIEERHGQSGALYPQRETTINWSSAMPNPTRSRARDLHPSAGLSTGEAADFLGVNARTLERWRTSGAGPKFVRISNRLVRYRVRDLEAWQEQRLVASTADSGPDPLPVEYPITAAK